MAAVESKRIGFVRPRAGFLGFLSDYRLLPNAIVTVVLVVICGFVGFVLFIKDLFCKGPRRMLCSKTRTVMPDVLKNTDFGTHEFIRLPNSRIKLHCVVNGPTKKPLMLFLHGFPEFWYSWRFQLREFSKDYRVVAVDMRGYGDSDKPSSVSDYIVDKLTNDVDQLIAELGYDKCILVAHDWGALIAWGFAAQYPERVDRLVICNCPNVHACVAYMQTKDGFFSQIPKSWYVYLFQVPVLPELLLLSDDLSNLKALYCCKSVGAKRGTFSAEDIDAFKYTFARYSDLQSAINYYRAAIRYASPDVERAENSSKIQAPTLIIWGTNDGFVDRKLAQLSAQQVEKCSLQYIEGASHWVQQEEPQQVNQFIRQFLKQEF